MQLAPINRTAPPDTGAAISDEGGAAMARAAVNLFKLWKLTDAEACKLLGGISERTYSNWKRGSIGRLGVDLKMRLSILMGIHKALRILFVENARAYSWIKKPNDAFGGASALEIMLGGQITDLFRVRHYLDAVRG